MQVPAIPSCQIFAMFWWLQKLLWCCTCAGSWPEWGWGTEGGLQVGCFQLLEGPLCEVQSMMAQLLL